MLNIKSEINEIYTWNKAAYWMLINLIVFGTIGGDYLIGLLIGAIAVAISFVADIIVHQIGKMLNIAGLRYLTFHTRTKNGKKLSILGHTLLWLGLAGIIASDYYPVDGALMLSISGSILILMLITSGFICYMIIRKGLLLLNFLIKAN